MSTRPFIIGVAGGTCSGKTTVAERLAEQINGADEPGHLALVKLDAYYWARDHEPFEERVKVNYDHPDAFDWPLLIEHVQELCAGRPVPVPVYDYANHTRSGEVQIVGPSRLIIVEGILVLDEPRLRDLFDLKVYVDADSDLRFIRRLERDVAERGRTPESIIAQYLTTVRPSHQQFIEPSKRHANVIIPHGGLNEPALDVLLARVRELI